MLDFYLFDSTFQREGYVYSNTAQADTFNASSNIKVGLISSFKF